jgi:hypothetical protein
MAYVHTAPGAHALPVSQDKPRARRGFFRRLYEAMIAARRAQVEREIAHYLHDQSKFTDEAEREIERRFLSNASRL